MCQIPTASGGDKEAVIANIKISAAADIGTLQASDMLPVARLGSSTAYHATAGEMANFTSTTVAAGAYGNVGRNLLHNSLLNIQQRGAGPWTADGNYTGDRWRIGCLHDTVSVILTQLNDTDRSQIGDEAAEHSLSNTFTGSAIAGSYNQIYQPIEDVPRLSGKTVTVSFWAVAASGTPTIGVQLNQNFGTGGSPSPPVYGTVATFAISTVWSRYSATMTLPSIAGKVLGNNADSYTSCNVLFSSAPAFVQSNIIWLWGLQLEVGSAMTPLEKPEFALDLTKCQRFYQGGFVQLTGYQGAGNQLAYYTSLKGVMRAQPLVNFSGTAGGVNYSSPAIAAVATMAVQLSFYAVAAGTASYYNGFTASADL